MSEFNSFEGCKPNMSFMPAYEDLNEAVFYMASSADREYAKLESAFNMAEVLGESYLVEETGIKGFFENIIKWVKEQFEKLAGLFKKAIDTLQKKSLEFSNKVKNKIKDKSKVTEKLKNLKGGDKVYGKTYEYPNWDAVATAGGQLWTSLDALENMVKDAVSEIVGSETSKEEAEDIEKNSKVYIAKVVSAIGADKLAAFNAENLTIDTSKLSEAIEKHVCGAEKELKKDDIVSKFDEMWNRTTEYRVTVASLQKDFKKLKKYYDDTIKALNGAAKQDAKKGGFNKAGSGYSMMAKAVKLAKSVNNCVGGTAIKIINKRVAKEQMIVWRCVAAATFSKDSDKGMEKATEKLKASQESASIDDITAQLFDFS